MKQNLAGWHYKFLWGNEWQKGFIVAVLKDDTTDKWNLRELVDFLEMH